MSADGDAVLARLLYGSVTDLLAWMGDYPDDGVDPNAVASIRRSVDWVLEQLPAGQRDRLASGDPDPAVKLLESGGANLDGLSGGQRRRLLEVLGYLATSEQHDGRRFELRIFPFAMGLVDDEPDDERPVRRWVKPEVRTSGSVAAG